MSRLADYLKSDNDQANIDQTLANILASGAGLLKSTPAVARSILNGYNAYQKIEPFLPDFWEGRGLIFRKPYKWMNKQEKADFGKEKTRYYKEYLNKHPVDTPIGIVNFKNKQNGEIDYEYGRHLPFVRYKLSNMDASKNVKMKDTKGRDYIDYFDNLEMDMFGNKYDYQIRNNKTDKSKDFYFIQPYELFEQKLQNPENAQYLIK